MTPFNLIVKVTNDCNLQCKYCYNELPQCRDAERTGIISLETVANTIWKFLSYFKDVSFIWHGGEPLLAGLDFYREIVNFEKNFKSQTEVKISNALQTNGTLIDDAFLKFFKDNDFAIGISIDGPPEIHNVTRPLKVNGDSYLAVTAAISKIKEYQGKIGAICVVSKYTASNAKIIYHHLKKKGLNSISLIPYIGTDEELKPNDREFFNFYKEIYQEWITDETPFEKVVPLDGIILKLLGGFTNLCSYSGVCFRDFLSVDPNGDVYPCAAIDNKNFVLGNINNQSLEEILSSPVYKKILDSQEKVNSECQQSCNYYDLCRGGCREAAFRTYKDLSAKDPYCKGRKMLFSYIEKDLKEKLKPAVVKADDGDGKVMLEKRLS